MSKPPVHVVAASRSAAVVVAAFLDTLVGDGYLPREG
jgi:hypothetical protein